MGWSVVNVFASSSLAWNLAFCDGSNETSTASSTCVSPITEMWVRTLRNPPAGRMSCQGSLVKEGDAFATGRRGRTPDTL